MIEAKLPVETTVEIALVTVTFAANVVADKTVAVVSITVGCTEEATIVLPLETIVD